MNVPSSVAPPAVEAFVGRKREQDELNALSERANHSLTTVFVCGESGVGKSALVEHFTERLRVAEDPALVLRGRCYERESVPYKAFDGIIDALSSALVAMDAADVAAILPEDVGLLARVFPVLRRVVDLIGRRSDQFGSPNVLRAAVFGALRTLIGRLARQRRVVLVIDDIHWTDEDSLALVREVLRPPNAPPLLVLATCRTDPRGTGAEDSPRSPAGLSRSWPGAVAQLTLEGLLGDDARQLARQLVGSREEVDLGAIVDESAGHPLFIAELIRHARWRGAREGQVRLEDAVASRLHGLDRSARELLELVAISSAPLPLDVVAEAASLEFVELGRRVSALRAAKLVRTSGARPGDRIEPYHDRVRGAALALVDPETKIARHGLVARVLEGRAPIDAEALAFHYGGAGDVQKQRHYTLAAARQAEDALAFHRAAELYATALALGLPPSEKSSTREKLGEALALAGSGSEAGRAYVQAARDAAPARSRELRRRAALQYLSTGHPVEGIAIFEDVLRELRIRLPKTRLGSLVSLLWSRLQLRLQGLSFREQDVSAVPAIAIERIDACCSAMLGFAFVDPIRASDFQARMLTLSLRAGEAHRICRALCSEMTFASVQGDLTRATQIESIVTEMAVRLGRPPKFWALVSVGLGGMALVQGRWRAALAHFAEVEAALRESVALAHHLNTWGGVLPLELWRWQQDNCNIMTMGIHSWMGAIRAFHDRFPGLIAEALEQKNAMVATNLRSGIHVVQWLAHDDVDLAERMRALAFTGWETERRASSVHYLDFFARAQIALYRGDAHGAYAIACEGFSVLSRALLLQASYYRVSMLELRGRCAVAAAASARRPSTRDKLLLAAERDASRIARDTMGSCPALAAIIRGSAAAVRGDLTSAARHLEEAVVASDRADMNLVREAARRRLGEIIGGDEGRALVRRADAWMTAETVKAPSALTRLFAPG
jgi:hypothetical protein